MTTNIPSGIQVFISNRMECLAASLAQVLKASAGRVDPLRPQSVMVQSKGMQRWISLTVARLNGICANIDFSFPNALLERLYANIDRALPEPTPYDRHVLTFRILDVLPDLLTRPEFVPLRRYLDGHHRPVKVYQLARKIADTFDQYVVYRPDLLLAWENDQALPPGNSNAAWQAALWRELVRDTDVPHRSVQQQRLVRKLSGQNSFFTKDQLPDAVSVFGISHLPPFHLDVLRALACRIPVFLFLLNPCRDYWFDILSDHQMVRIRTTQKDPSVPIEQLHLERGNRLLASLGHLGKQFFDQIYQFQPNLNEAFVDHRASSFLGRIQQDILDMVDRPQSSAEIENKPVSADGTLRIHSCHSPMREVEVLHDQLLDVLEKHPRIQPRDILVMAPNIGLYSPYIHAVFNSQENPHGKLPFTVADRSIFQESSLIESFIRLLDLVHARLEASRVVMLLECGAVCRQFGLADADVPIVEKWIRSAGIRWGWDAADRRRHKLPGYNANSWRNGLDRLILGCMMAEDPTRLFSGVLPYDGIGAGEARILGRLVAFAEAVHESLEQLSVADSLEGWHRRLNEVLNRMFKADERTEYERQTLHGMIDQFLQVGSHPGKHRPIPFEVIKQHIKDTLGGISYDTGFISGGITFCAMLPMRAIPAEVICLLGMNHDAYPREQHEPGFNLIAEQPRPGDRSKRNDDRYLFLETLISARNTLYISYIGQNIQDNSPIPPSVLVDELLEYANESLGVASDKFVVRHPLQGFSPSYFNQTDPLLFSYCMQNKTAAEQISNRRNAPAFFSDALEAPGENWNRWEWEQLARFFAHPCRFVLEDRLGLFLSESHHPTEDRESFVLDPLTRYKLNQQILNMHLKGIAEDQICRTVDASGTLPHGTVGKVVYREMRSEVQSFIGAMASLMPDEAPRRENVEVSVRPYLLYGNIDGLYRHARIICRMARTRPADLLKGFFFQLALAAAGRGLPDRTILICKDAIWHLGPIAEPDRVLKGYLNLFHRGLNTPLPFFIRTSSEFAHQVIVHQQTPEAAMAAALKKWRGNEFIPGECEDLYNRRCFGNRNPFTSEFEEVALNVYTPFFESCRQMDAEEFT